MQKHLLLFALPIVVFAGLISLAPMAPDRPENERTDQAGSTNRSRAGKPFNYIPDEEVFALELDPRRVRFGLLEGWDREDDAFEDISALAYVSGPMYERHVDAAGQAKQQKNPGAVVVACVKQLDWMTGFGINSTAGPRGHRGHR